jgi:putative flippase GtrA
MTGTRTVAEARLRSVLQPFAGIIREFSKFGLVGLVALIVDVGTFNLLMFAGGDGPLADRPLTAKAIAVIIATTVSYGLNRSWTFSHRARTSVLREYSLFFGLNGVAMMITLATLWFSHYALGLTSPLADNISANVIGLALGTIFRFWSYRRWVFPEVGDSAQDEAELARVTVV